MARNNDPGSATSEFAIQLRDNSKWLGPGGTDNYGYAVFMSVVDGWDTIEKIMQHGKRNGKISILDTYRKEKK